VAADFDPKKEAANIKKHGVSLAEGDGMILSRSLSKTIQQRANSALSPSE